MLQITFIQADGLSKTVHATAGDTLMFLATSNGIDGIIGECGGAMACATCHCHIDPDWLARTGPLAPGEKDMLDGVLGELRLESRLGCQVSVGPEHDGMIVRIPEAGW
jgi:Ferredoxin